MILCRLLKHPTTYSVAVGHDAQRKIVVIALAVFRTNRNEIRAKIGTKFRQNFTKILGVNNCVVKAKVAGSIHAQNTFSYLFCFLTDFNRKSHTLTHGGFWRGSASYIRAVLMSIYILFRSNGLFGAARQREPLMLRKDINFTSNRNHI